MNRKKTPERRGECLAPTDPRLLGNPLDFIAEDNLRERGICALMDKVAISDSKETGAIAKILSFLREELPLHLADEFEDVFPTMRRRCDSEDEIDKVIDRLEANHGHAANDTPILVDLLSDVFAGTRALDAADRMALSQYATHSRRHLVVENAILLPIARARLTEDDLDALRLRMLQRRGLDLLVLG